MCGEKRLRSVIHYFLYKVINLYMYAIFRYDLVLKVAITLVSLFLLLQFGRRLFANSGIRERVNPQAVKGYGYCEVNQSKLINYTVSYQCDFKPMQALGQRCTDCDFCELCLDIIGSELDMLG